MATLPATDPVSITRAPPAVTDVPDIAPAVGETLRPGTVELLLAAEEDMGDGRGEEAKEDGASPPIAPDSTVRGIFKDLGFAPPHMYEFPLRPGGGSSFPYGSHWFHFFSLGRGFWSRPLSAVNGGHWEELACLQKGIGEVLRLEKQQRCRDLALAVQQHVCNMSGRAWCLMDEARTEARGEKS